MYIGTHKRTLSRSQNKLLFKLLRVHAGKMNISCNVFRKRLNGKNCIYGRAADWTYVVILKERTFPITKKKFLLKRVCLLISKPANVISANILRSPITESVQLPSSAYKGFVKTLLENPMHVALMAQSVIAKLKYKYKTQKLFLLVVEKVKTNKSL